MSGEAIYEALTRGEMKTQAAGLPTGELFALIRYIAPTGGVPSPQRMGQTARAKADRHSPTTRRRPHGTVGAQASATHGFRMRPPQVWALAILGTYSSSGPSIWAR